MGLEHRPSKIMFMAMNKPPGKYQQALQHLKRPKPNNLQPHCIAGFFMILA